MKAKVADSARAKIAVAILLHFHSLRCLIAGAAGCGASVGMVMEAGATLGAEAVSVIGPVAPVARMMAKHCPW
jgi:hypothetical protein